MLEAFPHRLVLQVARVDALKHDGKLKVAERHVVADPGDIPSGPARVPGGDGLDVDAVDRGEHVGQPFGQVRVLLSGQRRGVLPRPEHHPGHVLHQVERRADHAGVGAERHRPGHRHIGAGQRRQHPEFARHVVRGGQHVAERRPAQHEQPLPGGSRDRQPVGEVRPAARDELNADQLGGFAAEAFADPAGQPRRVGNSRRNTGQGHDQPNRRTDGTENLNVLPMDTSRMLT
jgi:hypothetical protein